MSIISLGTKIVDFRRGVGSGTGSGGAAFSSTKSLEFDGVDDYVDTGITNTGTNDISVSCWIKTTETFVYTDSRCAFGGRSNVGGNNYTLGRLGSEWDSADDMKVRLHITYGTTKLNDGNWHNIIYTYNFTTKEVKAYVDGNTTAEATVTFAAWNTNYQIAIGWNGYTTAYYFEGNVDECAYFTRVLGASDITEIYNSGTPADISGMSDLEKWWRMGENSTFKTPQILMPENTNKDKVSNYSMAFDGLNDYIDCGSIIGGGGDISVSIWIKTSTSSWYDLEYPIVMYSSLGSGTAIGRTYGQGANRVIGIGGNYGTTKLNDGNWHHLVWTREISSGNMAGYVDGNATPEVTSTSVGTFIYNFRIGAYTNSIGTPTLWFDGLVDEVGYWNSVLSTSDIATIYNSGTPTDLSLLATPPVAWYRMGEEAVFNSTNWLLPNKAQDVFSRYSLEFDGVNDYVNCGNDSSLYPGTGDMSYSAWVNPNVLSGYQTLYGITGSTTTVKHVNIELFGSEVRVFMGVGVNGQWGVNTGGGTGGASLTTSSSGLTIGEWAHVAVTLDRNGNGVIYINGVANVTAAMNPNDYSGVDIVNAANNLIGNGIGFVDGKIDEVAIFNSVKAIGDLWDGTGKPTDLTGQSGLVSWWRMGEDATYDATASEWTIPDQIGSNTGTSANMTNDDLTGDAPGVIGNGTSANMTIEDRVGDAPDSSNNALSYNMDAADIVEEAP